jgi:hypothetical protein
VIEKIKTVVMHKVDNVRAVTVTVTGSKEQGSLSSVILSIEDTLECGV